MAEYVTPDIGLKNIPDAVRAKMFKEEDSFPYGGQWIFTGVQGSGKTLLLMHLVRIQVVLYVNRRAFVVLWD